MNGLKTMICTGIGIVGSTVAAAFGGSAGVYQWEEIA